MTYARSKIFHAPSSMIYARAIVNHARTFLIYAPTAVNYARSLLKHATNIVNYARVPTKYARDTVNLARPANTLARAFRTPPRLKKSFNLLKNNKITDKPSFSSLMGHLHPNSVLFRSGRELPPARILGSISGKLPVS